MSRPLHLRAATFLSSFVLAASLTTTMALASAGPSFAPPPPPDEPAAPAPQEMQQAGPLERFRQTLAEFGAFVTHPLYGEVWKPSEQAAPPGWSPYPVCHWRFDREQRTWTFADPTPWGAIVHHHGRWANDPQHGWIWVADANAGPGWVIWRNEARTVSWAPMLPEQHGNQPPRDGWQTQDHASFNTGCQQSPPPAPRANYRPLPDPGPMPMMAPAEPAYVGGGPVYIPGRPVYIPGHVHRPHGCHTGIRPSWCRPHHHHVHRWPHRPHGHVHHFPHRPHGHVHHLPHRPHGHVHHRPHQHRPFVGGFHGGHRMAMGHRGGGRSFRR